MNDIAFITIDGKTISLEQAFSYWQSSGLYPQMINDLLRQYALQKELEENNKDIQVNSFDVDQASMDFRVQSKLLEPDIFQGWLSANSLSYKEFQEQVAFRLKVEKLREKISAFQIAEVFEKQKPFLDRVILSRLILEDKDLAEQLAQKISADPSNFESLVQTHSITDDRVANGMMGAVPKAQMPEILRTAIDSANPGDIVGPMEIEGRYCLFRIEKFVPATLDDLNLKQELMNQIFEQWINSKIQAMDIRLDIN